MRKLIFFFVIVVVHGNLAWDFTMLVGDIKHQQKQKTKSTASVPTLGQIAWRLHYSNLQAHWQSFYSFLTQCLLPKWAPAEPPPEASLVTFQRKSWFPQNCASCLWPWQRVFSPQVYTKENFLLWWKKMNLTQISDILKRETGSVLPLWYVLVIFFLRLSVTLTYLFIFYGTQWGGSNASM